MKSAVAFLAQQFSTLLGAENVISSGDSLDTLSKDYYWYSPLLRPLLDDKRADLIVRPASIEELRTIIVACFAAGVPLTPRGAGTGNYGQCVPIHGGVVVDFARFNQIHAIADGVVRAAPGARLITIETAARAAGWELRCYPSTWVKATLGGFFGGGAGGIGGVRWGGIGSGDTVKSITTLTCEAEPRLLRLAGAAARPSLRSFGTTGFTVEIEMRLAPKIDYDQLALSHPSWDVLFDWTDAAARNGAWRKRVVSQFQWPIPSYFAPLKKSLSPDQHATFLMVDRAQTEEIAAAASAAGLNCVYRRPLADPPKPPYLSDFTFNHTTLWAMKADPSITYVQASFTAAYREQMQLLLARFPGEILLHLEWGAADPSRAVGPGASPAAIGVGGIPLVFYRDEARFREIIATARALGIGVSDNHSYHLPEPDAAAREARHAFKRAVDPRGLMNPGKLAHYPLPAFAVEG